MFFRQISDFESNFKLIDRLNTLLFNVWDDKVAHSYKDNEVKMLEQLYRKYISDMREISNELLLLQKQIDTQIEQLQSQIRAIEILSQNPSINGCWLCVAHGFYVNEAGISSAHYRFVASPKEMENLKDSAYRKTDLDVIEQVSQSLML